jgi:hypothetical protein
MHWLRLVLCAVLASELFLHLPIMATLQKAQGAARKSARILPSKRISDHWKERMLPVYARIIATNSVLFFVLLCVALIPVVLAGFTIPGGLLVWMGLLLQPLNMLVLFAVSVGYITLRLRLGRG